MYPFMHGKLMVDPLLTLCRTRQRSRIISRNRHGTPMPCAYGPIAIGRVNISATKYVRLRGKGTELSISSGPDLVISRER